MLLDALIIGGGPSGAAAGIVLARAGFKTAILERPRHAARPVGECLPPEVCAPLLRLGVWQSFKGQEPRPSLGTLSCWGGPELRVRDSLANPHGCGWHVDRARLDRLMVDAAREAGVNVHLGTAARSCSRDQDGRWMVEADCDRRLSQFRAKYIVCAVGRARGPRTASVRFRADRLVGYVAVLRDTSDEGDVSAVPLVVEATEDGWWYSARLPERRIVVGYMTDPDLRGVDGRAFEVAYWQKLRRTRLTRRWLDAGIPEDGIRSYAADTYWWPAASSDAVAVGDAAMGLDPLSGQGVMNALLSGEGAARAIVAAEGGDRQALSQFTAAQRESFDRYLQLQVAYYRQEQRWPNSPFWQRRHRPGY